MAGPRRWVWIVVARSLSRRSARQGWYFTHRGVVVGAATARRAGTCRWAQGPSSTRPGTCCAAAGDRLLKIMGKVVGCRSRKGSASSATRSSPGSTTPTRAALAQSLAQREQAKANLNAAQVAFDNAQPTFQRNQQQLRARGDQRADLRHRQGQATTPRARASTSRARGRGGRGHCHLRAAISEIPWCARRSRASSPSRRRRKARCCRRTRPAADTAHRRRHDRRHAVARGRGRRQRELHQPRASGPEREREAQRLSRLGHPGARHRDHPHRRPRQGHGQGARRFRGSRSADPAADGRARRVPRRARGQAPIGGVGGAPVLASGDRARRGRPGQRRHGSRVRDRRRRPRAAQRAARRAARAGRWSCPVSPRVRGSRSATCPSSRTE